MDSTPKDIVNNWHSYRLISITPPCRISVGILHGKPTETAEQVSESVFKAHHALIIQVLLIGLNNDFPYAVIGRLPRLTTVCKLMLISNWLSAFSIFNGR